MKPLNFRRSCEVRKPTMVTRLADAGFFSLDYNKQ